MKVSASAERYRFMNIRLAIPLDKLIGDRLETKSGAEPFFINRIISTDKELLF